MTDIFDHDPFSVDDDFEKKSRDTAETNGQVRPFDDMVNILRNNNILKDCIRKDKDEYIVTTKVSKSRRSWSYCSYVTYNRQEVEDLPDLTRDVLKIDSSPDNAKWDMFINEAVEKHKHKCKIITDIEKTKAKAHRSTKKFIIFVFLAVLIIISSSIGVYSLYRSLFKQDTIKPGGEIILSRSSYIQGEPVNFTILGEDNRNLKEITLEIKGVDGFTTKKKWTAKGESVFKESYEFPSIGRKPGAYTYYLYVKDKADNISQLEGKFEIEPDNIRPKGQVIGIIKDYKRGEMANCTIRAEDDIALKEIFFEVKDSNNIFCGERFEQIDIKGKFVRKPHSFSTQNCNPGIYTYYLSVKDRADNVANYERSFKIEKYSHSPTRDRIKPEVKFIGIKNNYIKGEKVNFTIQCKDNVALSEIIIEVLNSDNIAVEKPALWPAASRRVRMVAYAFSTKDWKLGTYTFHVYVKDKANNISEYKENFEIVPDWDEITGIINSTLVN